MSRRPDAARIREARHAALRARLISDGLLPDRADGWIETWRRIGGDPSASTFYEDGYRWIRAKPRRGAVIPIACSLIRGQMILTAGVRS